MFEERKEEGPKKITAQWVQFHMADVIHHIRFHL